jgi:hypothetical protein
LARGLGEHQWGRPCVTLATFWNDLGPDENEIVVAPAFTVQGKAAVDDYIREIESALFEPLVIGSQKLDFQNAYREMYLDAWKRFCGLFSQGAGETAGSRPLEAGRDAHAHQKRSSSGLPGHHGC